MALIPTVEDFSEWEGADEAILAGKVVGVAMGVIAVAFILKFLKYLLQALSLRVKAITSPAPSTGPGLPTPSEVAETEPEPAPAPPEPPVEADAEFPFKLDVETFAAAVPNLSVNKAAKLLPSLKSTALLYGINTPLRMAHFLAQVGHESGSFRYRRELWGPSTAQLSYEGRVRGLGNTQPGDGERFMGRGFIQITGRANYAAYGRYKGVNFTANPSLLEQDPYAMDAAGHYWKFHRNDEGNKFADKDDVKAVTKYVNGGLKGFADRKRRLAIAKDALLPGWKTRIGQAIGLA